MSLLSSSPPQQQPAHGLTTWHICEGPSPGGGRCAPWTCVRATGPTRAQARVADPSRLAPGASAGQGPVPRRGPAPGGGASGRSRDLCARTGAAGRWTAATSRPWRPPDALAGLAGNRRGGRSGKKRVGRNPYLWPRPRRDQSPCPRTPPQRARPSCLLTTPAWGLMLNTYSLPLLRGHLERRRPLCARWIGETPAGSPPPTAGLVIQPPAPGDPLRGHLRHPGGRDRETSTWWSGARWPSDSKLVPAGGGGEDSASPA